MNWRLVKFIDNDAILENDSNNALADDVDGTVQGCVCADPVYCIQP